MLRIRFTELVGARQDADYARHPESEPYDWESSTPAANIAVADARVRALGQLIRAFEETP